MLYQLLRRIAMISAFIGGASVAAAGVVTVTSIVSRALWSSPIQGDVELTQFGVALALSLWLPWCQLHGGNIIVDFFTLNAPAIVRRILDAIGAVLLAAMVMLLAWRTGVGAISVKEAAETSMILSLPIWIVYAVLAPGFGLTALIALYQAVMHLIGRVPAVSA